MPLMMIGFMVLCMIMMFSMMRHRTHGTDGHAIAILKERYARGEISQAEFDERRRVLQA